MEAQYNFQMKAKSDKNDWEKVEIFSQFYCERTTAIWYAKSLSRKFKSEIRLTEGKEPFKTSGTYIYENNNYTTNIMANWCNNKVTFTGNREVLDKVSNVFQEMIEKETKGNIGQLPDFVKSKNGYFCEIYRSETDECSFHYETRWSPNIEALWIVANHYDVGFVLDYEESGCMVFGKTICENQILQDYFLNQCDFQDFIYNVDTDCYEFEGENYDYKKEIVRILLDRKINSNKQKIA